MGCTFSLWFQRHVCDDSTTQTGRNPKTTNLSGRVTTVTGAVKAAKVGVATARILVNALERSRQI